MVKSVVVVGLLCGLVASASANTTYYFSGQFCQGEDVNDRDDLRYNSYGVTQDENYVFVPVFCPVGGNESDTVNLDKVTVRFIDQTDDQCLDCQVTLRTSTGTGYTSTSLYSANTTGGAATCTTVGTEGYGYLEWTTTELPNSGSSVSAVTGYDIECNIPTKQTLDADLQANSYVFGYSVEQVGT